MGSPATTTHIVVDSDHEIPELNEESNAKDEELRVR